MDGKRRQKEKHTKKTHYMLSIQVWKEENGIWEGVYHVSLQVFNEIPNEGF